MKLRLLRTVKSDIPIGPTLIAEARDYKECEIQVNQHGAVAVITPEGWLGVKPGEFEWLENSEPGDDENNA